ncbi:MAG: peptide chain release factor N(5)-glutamine methyltransferase [Rhodobacteraceae bacterium]|nr:peptide chain release factor N(5)-glutamine methyltransferase [Paracoccaceae bacterium]
MTFAEALREGAARLAAAGIPGAAGDARRLLAHVAGIATDRLILMPERLLTDGQQSAFDMAIAARVSRQPVAQITGQRQFWGRTFRVTRDTLDPRPETELVVAAALERPFVKMLDLGTGTGCILLSCLAGMPFATGTGTDLSAAALAVAMENAAALGLGRRSRFRQADWFAGISGRFDLIVSNPPYVAAAEMADLAPDVRDWEPHLALSPGGDGLDAYRAIAAGAGGRLMAGGRLILEIGPTQAGAVAALLQAQGFDAPEIRTDLDGRDRVVIARQPGDPGGCGAM